MENPTPNQAPSNSLNYARTLLAPKQIKTISSFGTLFAIGEITDAASSALQVGGISVRVDNGPWCPFTIYLGVRLREGAHKLEILNTTANLNLWVGFYTGDAVLFAIAP